MVIDSYKKFHWTPVFFSELIYLCLIGLELAYQRAKLDIAIRMAAGLLIASVIFFADLYFIIKNMDDPGEKLVKVGFFKSFFLVFLAFQFSSRFLWNITI